MSINAVQTAPSDKLRIRDALRDLLPFAQFKKREKHPSRSVSFRKVARRLKSATLLKLTLLRRCFSRFLNCTNGSKSRKASHMQILYIEIF